LTITSGESERWVGVAGKAQVILSAAPHTLPTQPFRLQVSDFKVDQDSEFRRVKTISYVIHAMAIKRAKQDGFDDALMVNKRGHVAEVTSANIFWYRRGSLYTPPLTAGCLEGTTRQLVMRQAAKLGLSVVEKNESVARIAQADEIFITSSLKLVIGVSEIVDGRKRYQCQPGRITQLLSDRMNRLAQV
jgi:branched-subunit amino acid aminotransferase/4-amino-4-deoxychorismate lyase